MIYLLVINDWLYRVVPCFFQMLSWLKSLILERKKLLK